MQNLFGRSSAGEGIEGEFMAIAIGVYDFFSYMVPGVVYLFVFNELLKLIGWKYLDVYGMAQNGQSAFQIFAAVLILIGAFCAGHIFDIIAHDLFFSFTPSKEITTGNG